MESIFGMQNHRCLLACVKSWNGCTDGEVVIHCPNTIKSFIILYNDVIEGEDGRT